MARPAASPGWSILDVAISTGSDDGDEAGKASESVGLSATEGAGVCSRSLSTIVSIVEQDGLKTSTVHDVQVQFAPVVAHCVALADKFSCSNPPTAESRVLSSSGCGLQRLPCRASVRRGSCGRKVSPRTLSASPVHSSRLESEAHGEARRARRRS